MTPYLHIPNLSSVLLCSMVFQWYEGKLNFIRHSISISTSQPDHFEAPTIHLSSWLTQPVSTMVRSLTLLLLLPLLLHILTNFLYPPQSNTLRPYLACVRSSLTAALTLESFPSQVAERHNVAEIEAQFSHFPLTLPLVILTQPFPLTDPHQKSSSHHSSSPETLQNKF